MSESEYESEEEEDEEEEAEEVKVDIKQPMLLNEFAQYQPYSQYAKIQDGMCQNRRPFQQEHQQVYQQGQQQGYQSINYYKPQVQSYQYGDQQNLRSQNQYNLFQNDYSQKQQQYQPQSNGYNQYQQQSQLQYQKDQQQQYNQHYNQQYPQQEQQYQQHRFPEKKIQNQSQQNTYNQQMNASPFKYNGQSNQQQQQSLQYQQQVRAHNPNSIKGISDEVNNVWKYAHNLMDQSESQDHKSSDNAKAKYLQQKKAQYPDIAPPIKKIDQNENEFEKFKMFSQNIKPNKSDPMYQDYLEFQKFREYKQSTSNIKEKGNIVKSQPQSEILVQENHPQERKPRVEPMRLKQNIAEPKKQVADLYNRKNRQEVISEEEIQGGKGKANMKNVDAEVIKGENRFERRPQSTGFKMSDSESQNKEIEKAMNILMKKFD